MTKKVKEMNPNIYTKKKLLSFPTKVNNNNNNKKKSKQLVECNCWVCKILDSVAVSETEDTFQYEPYNIVPDTGDSIFYNPLLLSNIFDNEKEDNKAIRDGQIHIAADRILNFVQQQDELAKNFSGVNFNKNEY